MGWVRLCQSVFENQTPSLRKVDSVSWVGKGGVRCFTCSEVGGWKWGMEDREKKRRERENEMKSIYAACWTRVRACDQLLSLYFRRSGEVRSRCWKSKVAVDNGWCGGVCEVHRQWCCPLSLLVVFLLCVIYLLLRLVVYSFEGLVPGCSLFIQRVVLLLDKRPELTGL